jgi:hypothetical protein
MVVFILALTLLHTREALNGDLTVKGKLSHYRPGQAFKAAGG